MPSPFPGMDPYLEQPDIWQDFHQRFVVVASEMLSAQVSPDYIVKIEEQLYVHESAERYLIGRSDVSVSRAETVTPPSAAATLLAAPLRVRLPVMDVEREAYIEIRDRQSRELVSVIELLSPSNKKPGMDRQQYLAKRGQLFVSSVHLVELDLLRGWQRLPLEEAPECDYYTLISRAEQWPSADFWPLPLRDRLPVIPVPLRSPSPDAQLDLQKVLDRVYDAAHYADYIYAGTPTPPLTTHDAAWAKQFIPQPS